MNKLFSIFAALFLALGSWSCQSFLDLVPEDDIQDLEDIFKRDESARNWFKTCYVNMNNMLPDYYQNPALMGGNEFVMNGLLRESQQYSGLVISEGYQNSYIPVTDVWNGNQFYESIRYIDIFLDNVDGVFDMLQADKDIMKAELKVLKAHYYFELMRRYGPFVIVDKTFDITDSDKDMQLPRSPLDECVKEIVDLIDDAREDLQPLNQKDISRKTYHSLESALMLKAQTLFYAASDLFNGHPMYRDMVNMNEVKLFPQVKDNEKWKLALDATLEAIEVAHVGNIELVQGVEAKATDLLTYMYDIERSVLAPGYLNTEAIHMVRPATANNGQGTLLNIILPRIALIGVSNHPHYNSSHLGLYGPSVEMVEKYYTSNGLPIEYDTNYFTDKYAIAEETNIELYRGVIPENTKTVALHLRREPRFYAHIAADRTYWQRGPTASDNIVVEAYRGELFGTTSTIVTNSEMQNHTGYWLKKHLNSELQTQTYLSSVSSPEQGHIVMRLAELYLMASEAANEYYVQPSADPDNNVYKWINLVRERAGIPSVEESWGQIAASDLHTTKEGMRSIIRREWDIEFAFEGMTFWNSRRWLTAPTEMTQPQSGWNILGETAEEFYRNGQGPMIVSTVNTFQTPRDYLFPIKAEEVLNSGLTQNLDW